jgi:hypothetical protein
MFSGQYTEAGTQRVGGSSRNVPSPAQPHGNSNLQFFMPQTLSLPHVHQYTHYKKNVKIPGNLKKSLFLRPFRVFLTFD